VFDAWYNSLSVGFLLEYPVELSVLVQRNPGNGYRAWCDSPLRAEAEGATREEALAKLRAVLEISTREVEVVRLTVGSNSVQRPVWPNDQITRDWLDGITAAKTAADRDLDPFGNAADSP
jgi:hypothetical protein